jgi:glycosyltransferase involved in cell wall biosynthesis
MKIYNYSTYFALSPQGEHSGVKKKIIYSVKALTLEGFESKFLLFSSNIIVDNFKFIYSLFTCNSKVLIIRFPGPFRTVIIYPIIIFKKINGFKIILDNPTPLNIVTHEIWKGNNFPFTILNIILLYLFYPWILFPYNRIIQYSDESKWFSFGLNNRMSFLGNGIDTKSIKPVQMLNSWPDYKFSLIAVASFQFWHGYDRLLHGLKNYLLNKSFPKNNVVEIIFVGEGEEVFNLHSLSEELGLREYVKFTGNLSGADLDKVFNNVHICVGTLGSYRKNMNKSSTLKLREYTARGLPSILSDEDFDFPESLEFIYRVLNDPTPIDFVQLLDWYNKFRLSGISSEEIRKYAENNLDFEKKVYEMFVI